MLKDTTGGINVLYYLMVYERLTDLYTIYLKHL
jgi:hypothetical protein